MDRRTLALSLTLLPTLVRADDDPEVTEDGLVRVHSNRKVGVYRAPGVPFTRYQRISIGSIPVVFREKRDLDDSPTMEEERERLRAGLVKLFREQLIEELVERGGYQLTDSTDPDVLRVDPSIIDLDVVLPDAGNVSGMRTFVRTTGSMQIIVELRDAASGVPVARIIDYETARDTGELQLADRAKINHDLRQMLTNAARYTREALNVAKTRREP